MVWVLLSQACVLSAAERKRLATKIAENPKGGAHDFPSFGSPTPNPSPSQELRELLAAMRPALFALWVSVLAAVL